MKYLLTFFVILLCSFSFAQKKKSRIVPPPVAEKMVLAKELKIEKPVIEDSEKCFVNTTKENIEGLDHYKDVLLEYGWAGQNARIVITKYDLDPVKEAEAKKSGMVLLSTKSFQFIDGKFEIAKNILTFTPDKSDKFEKRTFKLIYKSKKLNSLEGENKMIFKKGKCLEPMVSM